MVCISICMIVVHKKCIAHMTKYCTYVVSWSTGSWADFKVWKQRDDRTTIAHFHTVWVSLMGFSSLTGEGRLTVLPPQSDTSGSVSTSSWSPVTFIVTGGTVFVKLITGPILTAAVHLVGAYFVFKFEKLESKIRRFQTRICSSQNSGRNYHKKSHWSLSGCSPFQ